MRQLLDSIKYSIVRIITNALADKIEPPFSLYALKSVGSVGTISIASDEYIQDEKR